MAREQLCQALRGVSFTTATPFSEDGDRVLTDRLAENVRALYDEGARTFVPCGNTGEYYALSGSERVAVKFAVNDVRQFSRLTDTVSGDVEWINGVAERYAPAYALEGADGFTTGIGNFVPGRALALSEALSAGDWDRARTVRDALRPLEDLRDEAGGGPAFAAAKTVPVVKYGLDSRGMYGGPVPSLAVAADSRLSGRSAGSGPRHSSGGSSAW